MPLTGISWQIAAFHKQTHIDTQSRASVVYFGSSLLKSSPQSYQNVSTEVHAETVAEQTL